MPEAKTELYDIRWEETSFVDFPDNLPAKIVMWKDEPTLTDAEIEEIIVEAANERSAMPTMTTKTAVEREASRLAKAAYPDAGEAAGRAQIWAERPDLREAHRRAQATQPAPAQEAPVAKGATAFAKLDADARERYPDMYDRSPSAARTKAREKRPDLGDAYDAEFAR